MVNRTLEQPDRRKGAKAQHGNGIGGATTRTAADLLARIERKRRETSLSAPNEMLPGAALKSAFRAATRTPLNQIAIELQSLLTRQLTAYTIGVKDPKTITRWATESNQMIRDPEIERRLLATYQVAIALLEHDSARTVKAWFVGMNPALGNLSPVEIIRSGREAEALDAAQDFIANG